MGPSLPATPFTWNIVIWAIDSIKHGLVQFAINWSHSDKFEWIWILRYEVNSLIHASQLTTFKYFGCLQLELWPGLVAIEATMCGEKKMFWNWNTAENPSQRKRVLLIVLQLKVPCTGCGFTSVLQQTECAQDQQKYNDIALSSINRKTVTKMSQRYKTVIKFQMMQNIQCLNSKVVTWMTKLVDVPT